MATGMYRSRGQDKRLRHNQNQPKIEIIEIYIYLRKGRILCIVTLIGVLLSYIIIAVQSVQPVTKAVFHTHLVLGAHRIFYFQRLQKRVRVKTPEPKDNEKL